MLALALSAARAADPDPLAQLDARLGALGKAQELLDTRWAERSADLRRRVRALYRLSRAGVTPLWVDPAARLDAARLRAAARRILARDLDELVLLRDELASAGQADARLRRDRAQAAAYDLQRPAPSLLRPVPGAIRHGYGVYEDRASKTRLTRRGVELRAAAGDPVRAVAPGEVRHAGPLRGLELCVVIAHPDGTISILGRLASLTVERGATVAGGEVVGSAAGRRVYLEVRLPIGAAGLPVDPTPLLVQP